MTEGSNVHPVDRMAEIKAQIGELSREYDELRDRVVSVPGQRQRSRPGRALAARDLHRAQDCVGSKLFPEYPMVY